jgi:hypothetical protein
VSSIYQRLRERNLCNHRDFTVRGGLLLVSLLVFLSMRVSVLLLLNSPTSWFVAQNIGVNGAKSTSNNYLGVKRDPVNDNPALVFFAMVLLLVLCCAVLCCAVLCCAVLCCAVLCCAVLCCAVLK